MDINKLKQAKKARRQGRVRAKVSGTADMPRLSVSRSNTGMFLQIIDDTTGSTIVSAHSREVSAQGGSVSGGKAKGKKAAISFELGKLIARKALDKKIDRVAFDRGGNKYHGRVKMAADGAREGGLKF